MSQLIRRGVLASQGSVAESAEFQQFLSRISTPDTTHKNAYRAFINGAVTAGIWTKIDGLYCHAAADTTTAKVNLKQSSYGLTQTGTVTYVADIGCTSDTSTGFLSTGYDPSTAGGNFISNGQEGTFAVYIQTSDTSGSFNYDIHCGGNVSYIVPLFAGDTYFALGGSGANRTTDGNTRGSYLLSRTNSTSQQLYKNSATAGAVDTIAMIGGSTGNITLLSVAGGGNYSNRQNSITMFGGKLTAIEAVAYQDLANAYMTALGHAVY